MKDVSSKLSSDPIPKTIKAGEYRHNKTGNLYEVLGVVLHTETSEQLVLYRPLYDDSSKEYHYDFYVRPYEMFIESVEINGEEKLRFEKI